MESSGFVFLFSLVYRMNDCRNSSLTMIGLILRVVDHLKLPLSYFEI